MSAGEWINLFSTIKLEQYDSQTTYKSKFAFYKLTGLNCNSFCLNTTFIEFAFSSFSKESILISNRS